MNKLTDFFGLRKSIAAMLCMVILIGLGEKMAERFLPLYLIALGGGTFSIGLLNGLNNLLNALYSFPGGYASDKLGFKRALLLFNIIAIIGYVIVILLPYWQAVIIGSIFFLAWTAVSLPATMDMVATVLPRNKRTMGVTMHSLVRRIPMALGPIIGGVLILYFGDKTGIRLAFGVALALAIFSLVIQQVMIDDDGKRKNDATLHPWKALKYLNPDLRNLLVSDILIRFCEQIPYAFAVVWCVKLNNVSELNFGILSAVEMATAMLIYVPVAYFADKTTKKPFVVATFCFFTAFPLVLYFSHSFWALVGAFIIRGLKEFGEPTRKALIMDLAPEDKKAATFGLYYLIRDIIVSIASFGGAFLWDASTYKKFAELTGFGGSLVPWFERVACPELNLLAAFAFGLIGTIYFAAFGKDLRKTE